MAYDSLVAIYERAGNSVAAAMTGDALGPGISLHLASILLQACAGAAAACAIERVKTRGNRPANDDPVSVKAEGQRISSVAADLA